MNINDDFLHNATHPLTTGERRRKTKVDRTARISDKPERTRRPTTCGVFNGRMQFLLVAWRYWLQLQLNVFYRASALPSAILLTTFRHARRLNSLASSQRLAVSQTLAF